MSRGESIIYFFFILIFVVIDNIFFILVLWVWLFDNILFYGSYFSIKGSDIFIGVLLLSFFSIIKFYDIVVVWIFVKF